MVALAASNLAALLANAGKYAAAEPLFLRALRIYEHTLGPSHPETAATLTNLAVVAAALGKAQEAEADCRRALAIWERVSPGSPESEPALRILAVLLARRGDFIGAAEIARRDLGILEKSAGPDDAALLEVRRNLEEWSARAGARK